MRKRYLLVIIVLILIVSIFSIMYYLSLPTTFPNAFNEPQNQGNETPAPFKFSFRFPFIFPWQTSKGTTEGGGEGGESGSSGGSGSGGSANQTAQTNYTQKINYTLSLNSVPDGLKIFVSYYINDIISSITSEAPFELQTDANSKACVLPTYITGSGVLKWTLDGQDCQFSICEEYSSGCLVDMNANHLVTLYYTPLA